MAFAKLLYTIYRPFLIYGIEHTAVCTYYSTVFYKMNQDGSHEFHGGPWLDMNFQYVSEPKSQSL